MASKRKYDDPSPPRRRARLFAPASSPSNNMPPPASTPVGGAPASPSSQNMLPPTSPSSPGFLLSPPLDELQVAKQRAQKFADRLLVAAEVNPLRLDKDVLGAGGALGGSGHISGGRLGFCSTGGVDNNSTQIELHTDGIMKGSPLSGDTSHHGYCPPRPQANRGTPGAYLGTTQYGHPSYADSVSRELYESGLHQFSYQQSAGRSNYVTQNWDHSTYQQDQIGVDQFSYQQAAETSAYVTQNYNHSIYQQGQTYDYNAYKNQWQYQHHEMPHSQQAPTARGSEQGYGVAPQSNVIQSQMFNGYDQSIYGFGQYNYSQTGYGVAPSISGPVYGQHQSSSSLYGQPPAPDLSNNYSQTGYGVAPSISAPVYGQHQSSSSLYGQPPAAPLAPDLSNNKSSAAPPAPDSSDVCKIDAETLRKVMSGPRCTTIGRGGFGTVYRVCLDGKDVAIKLLNETGTCKEKELALRQFNAEVKVLSKIHHQNLVQLLAACETRHAIVYEFMPNGNLIDKFMTLGKNFEWRNRLQVAIDICNGLIYLHGMPTPIVHGDLSPGNILFDSTNVARLGDFGLSRILEKLSNSGTLLHVTEHTPLGTPGFVDPDYKETRQLRSSSDVYSFGVILLVLVTGLCDDENVRDIVQRKLNDGPNWNQHKDNPRASRKAFKSLNLVERHLQIPKENLLDVLKIVKLGLRCSGRARDKRPILTEVLSTLVSVRDAIEVKGKDSP